MGQYSNKANEDKNRSVVTNVSKPKAAAQLKEADDASLTLQQMANNSPQVKQLRAYQAMADDAVQKKAVDKRVAQRVLILPNEARPGGGFEPEIRTSANFDNSHLVAGEATDVKARDKRTARSKAVSTIVSEDAFIREVKNNDKDIINNAGTETTTRYSFGTTEAKIATAGGVLHAPTIDVMARSRGVGARRVIEIHHLHESEQVLVPDAKNMGGAVPKENVEFKEAPKVGGKPKYKPFV